MKVLCLIQGWEVAASRYRVLYLGKMHPAFEKLGKKYPYLELKIICDTFLEFENIAVVKKLWSREEEVEDLKSLDIGVMPLLDDPWSWGTCGLKILQY